MSSHLTIAISNVVVIVAAIVLYAYVRPDWTVLAVIVTASLFIVNGVTLAFRQQRKLEDGKGRPRVRLLWFILLLCWLLVALQFVRR